ncbi:MAG TPA: NAD(P)H-dependent glycerol-3-phosphate dehydrogenase [Acidimicrobiales bacterium]
MTIRVAVIGAGSWGTTVAALSASNTPTTLWARDADLARQIDADHLNPRYLPDSPLPETLRCTDDIEHAVSSADVVVMGVPSHGFRQVLRELAEHVRPWVPVVSLAKGLEAGTLKRMTQVIQDEVPGHPVAVLTGPNLAREIMAGQPAGSVVAIDDDIIGKELQRIFGTSRLRIYTNPDVIGCELAGVVKNVIAIASGMVEGMGFGDNTRATVITRGLAELTRLGVAMGGDPMTFSGLAGTGDLIATCLSRQSRNNTVGIQLGMGRTIEEILEDMHMVAEGVKSCPSVLQLARDNDVDMPITEQVVEVCHHGRPAAEAMLSLMARQPQPEIRGIRK